jgi:hypothetical protein
LALFFKSIFFTAGFCFFLIARVKWPRRCCYGSLYSWIVAMDFTRIQEVIITWLAFSFIWQFLAINGQWNLQLLDAPSVMHTETNNGIHKGSSENEKSHLMNWNLCLRYKKLI